MRDAVHKRKRRRQKFAGLNSAQSRHRSKYEDAEYTYDGSRRIRRLTADEVSAFRVHIQRLIDPDSVTVLVPVRRAVV